MTYALIPILACFVLYYCRQRFGRSRYDITHEIRVKVAPKLLSRIDSNLIYQPEKYLNYDAFCQSDIFPKCDYYEGSDLIESKYENEKFCLCSVECGTLFGRAKSVFEGVLLAVNLNKPVDKSIFVIDHSSNGHDKGYFGRLLSMDREFEMFFCAFCEDAGYGERTLDDDIGEALVALRKQLQAPVCAYLSQNVALIYIQNGYGIFGADIDRPLIGDGSVTHRVYEEIHAYMGFARALNVEHRKFSIFDFPNNVDI